VTVDGAALRVIYRGRANFGPGPDFRDALVSAPTGLLRGDVELHVRSSDFQRHGHHLDAAYDRVALHVVFVHDGGGPTELASGERVPVVALADWTERRARELQRWLLSGARYEEPCRSAVARLGAGASGSVLDRLGDMRFRARAAAIARRSAEAGAEQALWEALLEGAAGRGQRASFLETATVLTWEALRGRLAGVPARERARAAESLLGAAYHGPRRTPPRSARPFATPERRLRGIAVIAARCAGAGLADTFAAALADERAPRRLLALLTVAGAIGRGRAIELATNAALPWLAATGREDEAIRAYAALPLPARYGSVRHLHAAGAAVPLGARRQQGMLYLLKQYCTQGGCGRCPLS
jgi:hypothetical protein